MADSNPNSSESRRHEHELNRLEELTSYKCKGCKEFGGNVGYKCTISCSNFTMHEACATIPDVFQHMKHGRLKFRPKSTLRHHCDACGDVLKGFVFETERHHLSKELRLHPLCMKLPPTLQYSGHTNHRLLMDDLEVDSDNCNCSACNNKIHSGSWRYRCEERECNFKVDLSCAKINIYGLSVTRIAPTSRSRKVMSNVPKPAKWIAKAVVGVGLHLAAGEIINEMVDGNIDMAGLNNDHNDNRSSNNTNTNTTPQGIH